MGREDDGGTLVAHFENLAFEQIGIHRVEAAERFVEDEQLRVVHHRGDKLYLLLHTLGELFDFLLFPTFDIEFGQPVVHALFGRFARQAFELGQVENLFAHLHLFIETAFLGQVADVLDVRGVQRTPFDKYFALVGSGYLVDDTDQGRFTGTVGAQQSVNAIAGYTHGDIVESPVRGILLDDVVGFEIIHSISLIGMMIDKTNNGIKFEINK